MKKGTAATIVILLAAAPNTAERYWVDFTVTEIWPLEAR